MEIGNKTDNLKEKKQKIIEIIGQKGPLLPSAISREIGLPLLLTSAMLSDMRAENLLRLSRLKIGGSPLYYLNGQEAQLEKFVNHLPQKEREAFELLKRVQVVDERSIEPAYRVAFSNMKDFAFPVYVKLSDGEHIFWRFHSISQEEASKKIKELLKKEKGEGKEKQEIWEKTKERKEEKKEQKEEKETKGKIGRVYRKKNLEVVYNKIYEYLQEQEIEIEQKINEGAVVCIALANFSFGKAKMLVIANDKRKITESDLSLAYQYGLMRKMPVLFLTTGDLTKKALNYLELLGSYIFIKKI